jgi:hypothetical protein
MRREHAPVPMSEFAARGVAAGTVISRNSVIAHYRPEPFQHQAGPLESFLKEAIR